MEKSGILHLSTACISQETAGKLNECAFKNTKLSDKFDVYQKGLYGWFVPIVKEFDIESAKTIPEDLKKCMLYAKSNNCDWLAFDRDVEYIKADGLKEYTW